MEHNCQKYKALFLFANEEDFYSHLCDCNDCSEEQSKMNRVSSLIKEIAPIYLEKQKKSRYKKIVSCCAILIFGLASIVGFELINQNIDTASYQVHSIVSDMGLPVDDYGLLQI